MAEVPALRRLQAACHIRRNGRRIPGRWLLVAAVAAAASACLAHAGRSLGFAACRPRAPRPPTLLAGPPLRLADLADLADHQAAAELRPARLAGGPGPRRERRVRHLAAAPAAVEKAPSERHGQQTASLTTVARWIGRKGLLALGAVAGLVCLLYVTSMFEGYMERLGDVLTGRSPVAAGLLGLAVGMLHTVAGPDHLAGLAPLIIGQRRSPLAAFGLGALWGSGHATGQLLIGIGCLAVHVGLVRMAWAPAFGQFSGFLVGASLVAIGLLGFHEARGFEAEEVAGKAAADSNTSEKTRFGWTTYATGVLHGLSLDAVVFITPALALPRLAAAFHIAGVVGGTLLSMGVYTAFLSVLCRRSPRLKPISFAASSVAILLGLVITLSSLGISVRLPGL